MESTSLPNINPKTVNVNPKKSPSKIPCSAALSARFLSSAPIALDMEEVNPVPTPKVIPITKK